MSQASKVELEDGEYHQLCALIGHLFVAFARLEGSLASRLKLHLALKAGSNLSASNLGLASIIYGSQRFASLRDTVNRITILEKASDALYSQLKSVFDHIGNIQRLRDLLAHQQLVWEYRHLGCRWQIADAITVRDISKATLFGFDEEAVGNAGDDLIAASFYFGGSSASASLFGSDFEGSPPAWRYKPSMLKSLKTGNPTTRAKRKPQLPPSPE